MFSIFLLLAAKILAVYPATVVKLEDGDTVKVAVPAFQNTPFYNISVRIHGIDTPESLKAHAKCDAEIVAGKDASHFASTFAKVGDAVTVSYIGMDKYGGRILGDVRLADGRDWATTMLASGKALPYDGTKKADWCARLKKK